MKDYLQRLVRTVTNPAESVHPWTGSVFAASHQGEFSVVQTEELAPVTAARQSPEVMSPVPAQSDQASTPARTSPLEAGRNSLISELPATQISPVTAGAERSANRESSASERIIFKPLITNTERSVPNTVDATELEKRPARQVETAGSPRFLAGAEAVINARQLVVGSSRAPTEQNRPGAARDSFAPDRRTDEIEIHIGRIEVTAIHPPAPKEPKVRDKELSLDAYLKRRGGRAG